MLSLKIKTIGLLLFIAYPAMASFNGYGYSIAYVINHTKVANTDQSDFPVVISTTIANFANVANGGLVQNVNGYDLAMSSTSDCAAANLLNWEDETYSSTTGAINRWVKIPNLSHTVDTTSYFCLGNASIVSNIGISTGVWVIGNYAWVGHVPNGATLSLFDSTSNGNTGTNSGSTATAGKIDGGIAIVSTGTAKTGYSWIFGNLNITLSGWINTTTTPTNGTILSNYNAVSPDAELYYLSSGEPALFVRGSGQFANVIAPSSPINDGNWHYVVGTYDNSVATLYVDGVSVANLTEPFINGDMASGAPFGIGVTGDGLSSQATAHLDELRVSLVARGPDWIADEYANQSSPNTFAVTGPLVTASNITNPLQNAGLLIQGGKFSVQGGMVTIR